jgi:hypothetical protein
MPGCRSHYLKNPSDVGLGNRFVKQIAHTVHKYSPWATPAEREFDLIILKRHRKPIPIARAPHGLEAYREPFCITVLATRTHLGTASDRVPCRVGPLDPGVVSHTVRPWKPAYFTGSEVAMSDVGYIA